MTPGGWLNLILSVGFVTVLLIWCIYRVLTAPKAEPEHHLAHVEPIEESQTEER